MVSKEEIAKEDLLQCGRKIIKLYLYCYYLILLHFYLNFYFLYTLLYVCVCVCKCINKEKYIKGNVQTFLTDEINNFLKFAWHLARYLDSSYYCRVSFGGWLGTIVSAISIPLPNDLCSTPAHENISE